LELRCFSKLGDVGCIHLKRVRQRFWKREVSCGRFYFGLRFQAAHSISMEVSWHRLDLRHIQTSQHALVSLPHAIGIVNLKKTSFNRSCFLFWPSGLWSAVFMSPVITKQARYRSIRI